MIKTPKGLVEIRSLFGWPPIGAEAGSFAEKEWRSDILVKMALPFQVRRAGRLTNSLWVHYKAVDNFRAAFDLLRDYKKEIVVSGPYAWRSKRNRQKLSTHGWGIAIDINPETNRMGTDGDMPLEIISAFEAAGFFWGGQWSVKDPMHFQLATGY